MSEVALSIVAPVYNEAGAVEELARRCVDAARSVGVSFEVVLADDASTDATPTILGRLHAEGLVRHVRLEANRGQFGATQAGLAAARGALVIVLDGDLQDPPEFIPTLYRAKVAAADTVDVVFAAKARRDDPAWLRAGSAGYHLLQRLFGGVSALRGIGSYCVMPGPLAARIGALPWQRSNLSAVLLALGVRATSVPYDKAARYDGQSRVGLKGLVKEAMASMLLTGAIGRVIWGVASIALAFGLTSMRQAGTPGPAATWWIAAAVILADGALVLGKRRRALLGDATGATEQGR